MSAQIRTTAASSPTAPAWADGATTTRAFLYGLRNMATPAGGVLVASALGFGALVREMGLGLDFAIVSSLFFYALPAQVVLADQIGRGASLLTAIFAVTLTGVRMVPMVITLVPLLRDVKGRRWLELLAVHCIAVTAWLEGHRRLYPLPVHLRLPHFLGFGLGFVVCTILGAGMGHVIAAVVPFAVSAALMTFTPMFFLLSMMAAARPLADKLAIALGLVIGPAVYLAWPGLDLLVAGLVGGTVSYMVGRAR